MKEVRRRAPAVRIWLDAVACLRRIRLLAPEMDEEWKGGARLSRHGRIAGAAGRRRTPLALRRGDCGRLRHGRDGR